ncbi:hypothetical protein [Psychrobacter glaciei]|uniref:hypothetical protein n=1 Tax=Psychrobacter glaciei TaxID=619771 RepID=UPI001F05C2A2|nr:hypothetical protein [Psychrobacter glaciei]MCH1783164.1 hypothetical protein [Psychrobacter glaciei]
MSDIESSATVTVPSYPKGKVIGLYGLLGGVVGGLILFLYIAIGMSIDIGIPLRDSLLFVKVAPAFILSGFFGGLLPALLAGYIVSKFKIYFNSVAKVIPLFIIGFMSTFSFVVWFMIGDGSVNSSMTSDILFCCNGGVSAIITGLIALPKHK